MKSRFLPSAEQELDEAIAWYEAREAGLGTRFLERVYTAVERIEEGAETFAYIDEPYRYCSVRDFPYNVIYAIESEVLVIAVIHESRRPGYWKGRLPEPEKGARK